MDDQLNKNPFDTGEIDKIQQDIDRDLYQHHAKATMSEVSAPTDVSLNPDADVEPEMEGQISLDIFQSAQTENKGLREVVESSVITQDYGCAVSESACEDSPFFKETVKNETEKKSSGRFKRFVACLCIVSILGGISAGIAIPVVNEVLIPRLTSNNTQPTPTQAPNFSFVRGEDGTLTPEVTQPITGVMSYADLIEAVEPSVVCITSNVSISTGGNFFTQPSEYSDQQGGSGIIFDKDDEKLYIVTNNHVVSGADAVTVSVNKGEDVPATLVGREADSDLAVISVNIRDLQQKGINDYVIAAFGSSQSMRVGDFVIAIGNALGAGNTATFGFVSAIDKEITIDGQDLRVVQTDAAINPGNSGGPLINLKGEVIGINMVKYVEARVEGTGYALTSDVAMPIIESIRNQTVRPILGIRGISMTETVASAFNLPMMGVIVDTVVEGSGAYKAGIKQNDIITSFNGVTVLSMEQLQQEVQQCSIGDKVEVKVIRNGSDTLTFTVTLAEDNSANF